MAERPLPSHVPSASNRDALRDAGVSPRAVPVAASPDGRKSPGPFCLWKEQQSMAFERRGRPHGNGYGRLVRIAALLSIAASMAVVVMKVLPA